MTGFVKRTWAEINLDNIEHNYNEIKRNVAKGAMLCCVIKADGYGHGAVELAREYSRLGADWFAVSNIEEAIQLREADIKEPILILGYTPCKCAKYLSNMNISQAVYSPDYAENLAREAENAGVRVKIHLKLDTGMSRIGLMCQSFERDSASLDEAERICRLSGFECEGVFTHFAVADEAKDGENFTRQQFSCFMHSVNELEKRGVSFKIRHCANSGAIIDYKEMHLDMVRAGIILYGLSPSQKLKDKFNLIPAMELKSVISHIKTIESGATVSYGRTYKASERRIIATIPIGYADGYIRTLAKDGSIGVAGKRAKIVGRVCMDQLMADVTDCGNVKRGDCVTVFGTGDNNTPTVDELALWSNTINYEVVCLVGKRVARVYTKDGKIVNAVTLTSNLERN